MTVQALLEVFNMVSAMCAPSTGDALQTGKLFFLIFVMFIVLSFCISQIILCLLALRFSESRSVFPANFYVAVASVQLARGRLWI